MVLAGGAGRRMGGRDKGLVPFQGRPMVATVIDRLAPQVGEVLINANRNQAAYAELGYPVIEDDLVDFQGPLAGMLAGLRGTNSDWLATVPCDSPLLPLDLVTRLLATARQRQALTAMAAAGGRTQPVFALIATSLAHDLENYLSAGERKIDHWLERHACAVVEFDDVEAFRNINSPDELTTLEDELAT